MSRTVRFRGQRNQGQSPNCRFAVSVETGNETMARPQSESPTNGIEVSDSPTHGRLYSFEEYNMYYDFTERVTDRRLTANSLNYGISTSMIVAIAALTSWTRPRAEFRFITIMADLALSIMGAFFVLCGSLK